MLRLATLLAALAAGTACKPAGPSDATAGKCDGNWQRQWNRDSTVSLCLPVEYVSNTTDPYRAPWQRGSDDSPDRATLAIQLDTTPLAGRSFPPHLETPGPCEGKCPPPENLVRYSDTLPGRVIYLETGVLSGGHLLESTGPILTGGWLLPGRGRVWVGGRAKRVAALDTLRAAIRTVQIREPR
jgi:hypothetical protein